MCNCASNPCACDTAITLPYLTGDDGSNGIFGGYSAKWKFETSTSSGPGSTYLRFNNATYSSVSNIYIADTNADSVDYDLFLDSFSNNLTYGYIRIFKEFDSSKFWLGQVTGVTDNGTTHTIAVNHILSNSTFAADDNVVVTFTAKGASGTNGTDSATKAYIEESFIQTSTYYETKNNTGVLNTELTIDANTLPTNGDVVQFEVMLKDPGSPPASKVMDIDIQTVSLGLNFSFTGKEMRIKGELSRVSSTILYYTIETLDVANPTNGDVFAMKHFEGYATVTDLAANPFDIELRIITLPSSSVELHKYQSKIILK